MAASASRRKPKTILCGCGCGERFTPSRPWQKFASPKCRTRHWIERHYGPEEINRLKARIRELESKTT
jgi:hypothetical protein